MDSPASPHNQSAVVSARCPPQKRPRVPKMQTLVDALSLAWIHSGSPSSNAATSASTSCHVSIPSCHGSNSACHVSRKLSCHRPKASHGDASLYFSTRVKNEPKPPLIGSQKSAFKVPRPVENFARRSKAKEGGGEGRENLKKEGLFLSLSVESSSATKNNVGNEIGVKGKTEKDKRDEEEGAMEADLCCHERLSVEPEETKTGIGEGLLKETRGRREIPDLNMVPETPRSDVTYADIPHTDVTHADVRGADVRGIGVRDADVSNADVKHADVRSEECNISTKVQMGEGCFEIYALVPGLGPCEIFVKFESKGKVVIMGSPENKNNFFGITPFVKEIALPKKIDTRSSTALLAYHGQLYIRANIEPES